MSGSHHSGGSANGKKSAKTPKDIMNDVTLLLADLTAPETQVEFGTRSRANPTTIENTISPPAATWSWKDLQTRDSQASSLTQDDVSKYGIVESIHTLYKLVSISPTIQWLAVNTFTDATWQWVNLAERMAQKPTAADVEK